MHDFQNLLRKRRSIREFADREVPEGRIRANLRDSALPGGLGLAADLQIVAPVIVGYPKAVPEQPERNEPVIPGVAR